MPQPYFILSLSTCTYIWPQLRARCAGAAATDSDEYEVEKILTRRGENDHLQYLIKWKGYPMDDCSWEPASNLKNSKRILAAFNNKHEIELQRRLL